MKNQEKASEIKQAFLLGARAGVPVVMGYIPVGMAYAVLARQAGFSLFETCLMSLTVYAGAAEIMSVGMYAQGVGILTIIFTTFILNLRHIIMSTCVNNFMRGAKLSTRLLASFGVTDETFAVFTSTGKKSGSAAFFTGLALVSYLSWNFGTILGGITSELLPPIVTGAMGIALYAMFIALLLPGVRGNNRLLLLVILTAGVNSALCQFIPSGWAMIISTLSCAAVGVNFIELEEIEQ